MRVLEFIAEGQKLRRDPDCDFTGIVAGSRGYLQARFRFSKEWSGCKKVAVFMDKGKPYPAGLKDNMCIIPWEALETASAVQVYVIGRRPGYEITTTVTAFPQIVNAKGGANK